LVLLIDFDGAYCVPKPGSNYKGHENFTPNPCETRGDELLRRLRMT
jgi:hypothetical protein